MKYTSLVLHPYCLSYIVMISQAPPLHIEIQHSSYHMNIRTGTHDHAQRFYVKELLC